MKYFIVVCSEINHTEERKRGGHGPICGTIEADKYRSGILILLGFWVFYGRLDKKIDRLGEKVEKLDEKVQDIDRRLCRIEGSLASHGHCLFHQTSTEKKTG